MKTYVCETMKIPHPPIYSYGLLVLYLPFLNRSIVVITF
jgi:hypothetical protein